ncbi:MAG TPA: FAD-dependent monooxygenase [Steroidobacteraceae bacterium]|nr:FAD-dependent monooxygenase [Steroidobacteraceae bacterium]
MQVSFSNGRYALPEYPFCVPPELSGAAQQPHPVAIVGAGLAGLTAACALAQLGVPAVVLDDDNTVGARGISSRGVCYARKSLEIFDRLGIYRRMLGKGVRWTVGRTFDGGTQVCEFDLASDASASRQPPFINLQQFYVESFLIERAAELGGVDLRWRNKVVSCESDTRGARLSIETPAGAYSLHADWVIDCSGARGGLAESLGLRRRGTCTDDRWCIADIIFDEPLPAERHTWVSADFNDGRAVWRHALADNVWRHDYQLDPANPEDIDEQAIRARLRRQFGRDVACRIIWTGTWSYRSECLESFRHDRVLFAGDCAHTMSPFGGRGGNSGIQDADNLAWKLAWVIEGKADASLLDTYTDERRAAALENIRTAERTGRFLRPASPAGKVYREATLALARHHAFARPLVNTGRMSQPNTYVDSRLNVGRGGGRSIPNLPLALPDGRDGDVAQLMKWAGGDLVVLVDAETDDLIALEARFPVRIVASARLGIFPEDHLVLLRPDLYCAGTFERGDVAGLEHALRTFTCTSTMTGTRNS